MDRLLGDQQTQNPEPEFFLDVLCTKAFCHMST